MPTREACERRVYRLATLLTGNPLAATGVITAVVDAQPDLTRVDSTHLDRLTVLRSRELRPGMIVDDRVDSAVAEALADLSPQCREAWIFARVYRMPLRSMAKAMDCSVGATERHLEQADGTVREALGRDLAAAAPKMLLAYSMSLDVPAFFRAQQRRRRIVRRLLVALLAAVCLAALIWLLREYAGPPVLRTGSLHSIAMWFTAQTCEIRIIGVRNSINDLRGAQRSQRRIIRQEAPIEIPAFERSAPSRSLRSKLTRQRFAGSMTPGSESRAIVPPCRRSSSVLPW